MVWRGYWACPLAPHRRRGGIGRPPLPLPTVAISDPYYRESGGAEGSGGEFAVFVGRERDKGRGGREGREVKMNGALYSVCT